MDGKVKFSEQTAIRGIFVSPAASWLRPVTKLAEQAESRAIVQGMTIFFLGDYGRWALEEYIGLARQELIPLQCMQLRSAYGQTVHAVGGDVRHGCMDDLIAYLACDTAILVYEERSPDDCALAGALCEAIKKVNDTALTIGMHPFKAVREADARLDLTLQSWQNHMDFMPRLIRTFARIYPGSICLGDGYRFNAQLQEIILNRNRCGVLLFQKMVRHYAEIEFPGDKRWQKSRRTWLGNPIWLNLAWIIIEMHCDAPDPLGAQRHFDHSPQFRYMETLVLPHAGLADTNCRVTVFGFVVKF